jgi:uncharacterized protein (TIGR04141 family)
MLKTNFNDCVSAIKNPEELESIDITLGTSNGTLYFKQNPSYRPSWVKLFEPMLGSVLNTLFNSGTSAVLIVSAGKRYFAMTFGYGKSLLLADCYEENFGLRTVLNSVDPEKLRSIDIQSLDAVPLNKRSQASVATAIADFGLDTEQDLVYAATGKPKDVGLGKQLTGKDALKISVPIVAKDIPGLLNKLSAQYEAETYKENFAWVDHLSEVRTTSLIEKLDTTLTEKIQKNNFDRTWLSIPDIIEWSDISGFKYQKPKQGDLLDDIDWNRYLEFLGTETLATVETFRKQSVHSISETSGQPINSWSVYRCIYCELSYDEADYALNNGKWYKVNVDFLTALNEAIKQIPISKVKLPVYSHKDEGAYNKAVHDADSGYFALMDKQNIFYGGGKSQIEFCDLYTTEQHIIHVKRYGGSSVLSHLFAQGTVSARLFLSDPDFRKKLNQKLPSSHKLKNVNQKPKNDEFEVVYAIASNSATASPELPLFSKINLRNSFNQLQMYGMKVSLTYIQVI